MTEAPEQTIYARDEDGTGSMHACSKEDPGSVAYTRSDIADTEIARLRAEIERMREALEKCVDPHNCGSYTARAALKESDQ